MISLALEVTRHEVMLPGLGEGAEGLRVAQLSDLHRGACVGRATIRNAVDRCNQLTPDLGVLTGDYVTGRASYADCCCAELARLRSRFGSYAVLGNHDHLTDAAAVERALANAGIEVL